MVANLYMNGHGSIYYRIGNNIYLPDLKRLTQEEKQNYERQVFFNNEKQILTFTESKVFTSQPVFIRFDNNDWAMVMTNENQLIIIAASAPIEVITRMIVGYLSKVYIPYLQSEQEYYLKYFLAANLPEFNANIFTALERARGFGESLANTRFIKHLAILDPVSGVIIPVQRTNVNPSTLTREEARRLGPEFYGNYVLQQLNKSQQPQQLTGIQIGKVLPIRPIPFDLIGPLLSLGQFSSYEIMPTTDYIPNNLFKFRTQNGEETFVVARPVGPEGMIPKQTKISPNLILHFERM